MAVISCAVFWIFYHRRQKAKAKALVVAMETPSDIPHPPYIYVKNLNSAPVEMDTVSRTVELSTARRTIELGTATDVYPGYR